MSRLTVALWFIAVLLAPACGGGSESASGGGGGSGASSTGGTGGAASGSGGANAGGIGGMTSGGTTSGGAAAGGASGSGATSGSSGSSGQGGSAGDGAGGNGGTGQGGASGAGSGGMPGGAGMGGAGQGQGGGAACGTVADTASPVPETQRTGSPPAPMGGTLTDGTYHLTAWNVYPPATADSEMHSTTLRISLGTFEVVVDGSTRESGSVSTAGVVVTFTPSCPTASPASKPYSATATTLSLITVAENRVEALTKQ